MKISLDRVLENSIIIDDITNSSGNVLLKKGATLSSALIRRLKNWGITYVVIEGKEEENKNDKQNNISREELKQQLEKKFGNTLKNINMRKIFDAVLEFRTNK